MRPAAAAALALLLAGCGGGREPAAGDREPNGQPAAAPSPARPAPAVTPVTAAGGTPATTASATPVPASSPADGQSAEAAKALVERYYALIGGGDYAAARALWRNGGAASGMDPAAFAQSFAGYASYRATVGPPGRIDAGAGQRYVTVPVEVRGSREDGTPFAGKEQVTLHRAGDIDGATAEQRAWRIETIERAAAR